MPLDEKDKVLKRFTSEYPLLNESSNHNMKTILEYIIELAIKQQRHEDISQSINTKSNTIINLYKDDN